MMRLGIRRRLLLAVVAAVTISLAATIAGFNLLLERNLSRGADDLARSRARSQVALVVLRGDDVTIDSDVALGDNTWVFAGSRVVREPHASANVDAAARRLATGPPRLVDVEAADLRLASLPIAFDGRRVGTVVAGVSLEPYEETRSTALWASLGFGAGVLLLVVLAASWLLSAALRPVTRMTRQAAEWSETELDQRFALGAPHDELTELAATLDGMLDRLAASLRREQRFSAELSHELRTLLARVLTEAELALRREREPSEYRAALEVVHQNARQLARTVDALVAAARHESGIARGTADAREVADAVVTACSWIASERGVDVATEASIEPVRLGVEADLAERILQPLVENACRYGRRQIRISVSRTRDGVLFAVDDDGPGVPAADLERIFEPGERGAVANGSGAGLGLALARRLAHSVSGDIQADADARGGRFRVTLPAG